MITKLDNYKIKIENGIVRSVEQSDKTEIEITNDGNTEVLKFEENSGYVTKGLVDSHAHIFGLGVTLLELNLENAESIEECLFLCKKQIERGLTRKNDNITWLIGRGWNQEKWANSQMPTKEYLDAYLPNIAVYLTRIDGHSAWVNSKALEIANITEKTQNPIGGEILKNENNSPTGILVDNAMEMVKPHLPKYSEEQIEQYIQTAVDKLVSVGLTEIHDMDVNPNILKVFKKLDLENKLKIKVKSFVSAQNDEWISSNIENETFNSNANNLEVKGLKFYSDGALGSRGAYLIDNYSDEPTRGLLFLNEEDFLVRIKKGAAKGWQIVTHAIGDAANRFVLDVYARFRNETKNYNTILRIEHAQIVHPDDLHKFEKYKIYATVQPTFCLSDFEMAKSRLGERINYSYPWQTLINQNVLITGSSDFPIETYNPMLALEYLTNRLDFEDKSKLSAENINPSLTLPLYNLLFEYILGKRTAENIKTIYDKFQNTNNNTINSANEIDLINEYIINQYANFSIFTNDKLTSTNECLATIINGKIVFKK